MKNQVENYQQSTAQALNLLAVMLSLRFINDKFYQNDFIQTIFKHQRFFTEVHFVKDWNATYQITQNY